MHQQFVTTTTGLDRDSFPLRLYEKAKKYGIWNPSDLNMLQDAQDWQTLQAEEKDILLRLTAMFQAGEEAVTLDLLPLIMIIAQEGRLEEEMYLTTFLFEEAKHTDFFHRFLSEVSGVQGNLNHYHSDNYKTVFYEALPTHLHALRQDASPKAQVRASVTYNIIVEGMLAETGYHAYFTVLDQAGILPGTKRGIQLLKQDESRHIAYGIYLISRLLKEQPSLYDVVEETVNELVTPTLAIINDIFSSYDPMPFDLDESMFIDYALDQFQKRVTKLEAARDGQIITT